MSHGETVQPRKTRELQNHHMDSRIWNDFTFRDDDIVIATYAKAGTTWTQQIVGQLVFRGDDLRVRPRRRSSPCSKRKSTVASLRRTCRSTP
jgi:hypothetical protein